MRSLSTRVSKLERLLANDLVATVPPSMFVTVTSEEADESGLLAVELNGEVHIQSQTEAVEAFKARMIDAALAQHKEGPLVPVLVVAKRLKNSTTSGFAQKRSSPQGEH